MDKVAGIRHRRWLWRIGTACFLWLGLLGRGTAVAQETADGDNLSDFWERVKTEVLGYFERFDDYLSRTRLLTVGELQSLPVGLQTKIGQTVCDLLVTEAVFGPDYTDLTVFLRITTPSYEGGNLTLYFGSEEVRISAQGGFVGDLKLALLSEVNIGGKGGAFKLVLDPARKRGDLPPTYAIVGCGGFEEMQVNGRIVVSKDYAKPVFNGKPLENRELEIPFSCTASWPTWRCRSSRSRPCPTGGSRPNAPFSISVPKRTRRPWTTTICPAPNSTTASPRCGRGCI